MDEKERDELMQQYDNARAELMEILKRCADLVNKEEMDEIRDALIVSAIHMIGNLGIMIEKSRRLGKEYVDLMIASELATKH